MIPSDRSVWAGGARLRVSRLSLFQLVPSVIPLGTVAEEVLTPAREAPAYETLSLLPPFLALWLCFSLLPLHSFNGVTAGLPYLSCPSFPPFSSSSSSRTTLTMFTVRLASSLGRSLRLPKRVISLGQLYRSL